MKRRKVRLSIKGGGLLRTKESSSFEKRALLKLGINEATGCSKQASRKYTEGVGGGGGGINE